MIQPMNIAEHIISKCSPDGTFRAGVMAICGWCDLEPPSVYRWTYPVERGGTGGYIPFLKARLVLRMARSMGIPLQPSDFFDPADLVAVNDNLPAIHVGNNTEGGSALQASPRENTQ